MTVHKLQTGRDAPLSEEEFGQWQAFIRVKHYFDKRAAEGNSPEAGAPGSG